MKTFALIISLLSISSVHACLEDATRIYKQEMNARRHQHINVYPEAKKLPAGEQTDLYGTVFSYDEDVSIYEGTSEFMSGFGVEAIVMDPKDCSLIEMVQVYAE